MNQKNKIEYTSLTTYADRENITYKELSEAVGIHYQTFFNIIKGHSQPGKKTRRKLDAFITAHRREIEAALRK
ncbi:MAG: hypothetical protein M0P69_18745 [Bacteroidales bacterium]|nr:hypothetical protein [Bacteroidales bacterium]